ncbi:MAG: sensor histidine kinase [Candidatus Thorarchaeota archaeon]|nr:sensor histidine kinase [Candidatus Thorarchaeota archaeon]
MPEKNVQSIEAIAHQILCLNVISKLFKESQKETSEVINTLVHLLPEAWQYPNDTCARVIWDNKKISSANFRTTDWLQRAEIAIGDTPIGAVEVYYLEEKPCAEEGPFLLHERNFIDTVAAELGRYMELKQVERTKDQLHHELELYASLLRHDFRNDLGVILGNVEIAKMTISDRDDVLDEILASTEAVCERMLNLLNAFGAAAKMADTDPIAMIGRIANQIKIASMGMKVEVMVDESVKGVRIPASQLLPLVFDNLLRNAEVYAGNHPTVTISISKQDDTLRVVVADDGPGVAKEIRGALFQKGVSTRGGGLGLYLSRRVLETMGGSIELIDSDIRRGASFEILLPIVD